MLRNVHSSITLGLLQTGGGKGKELDIDSSGGQAADVEEVWESREGSEIPRSQPVLHE